jgi:hypothetical protein
MLVVRVAILGEQHPALGLAETPEFAIGTVWRDLYVCELDHRGVECCHYLGETESIEPFTKARQVTALQVHVH